MQVAFTRCSTYEEKELSQALRRLLEPLGGMASFVKPGQKVLLKPNFVAPATAQSGVTTHPQLIKTVFRAVQECSPLLVHLRDNPATAELKEVSESSGLATLCPDLPVLPFLDFRPVTEGLKGKLNRLSFANEVFDYDCVINLPKLKTHCQMTMTLAVKNWFGLVDFDHRVDLHLRAGFHFDYFADLLLDLYKLRSPDLNILDGVIGMEGQGPSGGNPVRTGFMAAAASGLVLDRAVVEVLGLNTDQVLTVKRALERDLVGEYKLTGDKIACDPLKLPDISDPGFLECAPAFIRKPLLNTIIARPRVDPIRCISCGKCRDICPPKAIIMRSSGIPKVDALKCIRCFCCTEVCPAQAIKPYHNCCSRALAHVMPHIKKRLMKLC